MKTGSQAVFIRARKQQQWCFHLTLPCHGSVRVTKSMAQTLLFRKQFCFWSVAWGGCSPWVWQHRKKRITSNQVDLRASSVIWLFAEEAYFAWLLWLWVILQSECPSVRLNAPLPNLLTSPVSYLILCIWMLTSVCILELMPVLDMINVILVAPRRNSTRVPFYCLLSQRLQSLSLLSAHGIKTCEITGIYIGRFGSSFIFFLELSDVNQCYSTLSKNVLECACVWGAGMVSLL